MSNSKTLTSAPEESDEVSEAAAFWNSHFTSDYHEMMDCKEDDSNKYVQDLCRLTTTSFVLIQQLEQRDL